MSVIVVAGCTGTGKTKLGVEIAHVVDGEVISADSMQVYQGLDIISNTVTDEEMEGVVHHCINYVPVSAEYDVIQYTHHTIPIIEDIIGRGKVPIIVGGTAYYIEALLWNFTMATRNSDDLSDHLSESDTAILEDPSLSSYEKLKAIDPSTAEILHPNNSRRIERCLELTRELGVRRSSVLECQEGGKRGQMRWERVLLFSLESDLSVLDSRLDRRVDSMVDLGLLSELESLLHHSGPSGLLSQVIGYKEFADYLELKKYSSSAYPDSSQLEDALNLGLERMKCRTRQYARKQLRWIKSRLSHSEDSGYHFRKLDSSQPEHWSDHVSQPALRDVRAFMRGDLVSDPQSMTKAPKSMAVKSCEPCGVMCEGETQYNGHVTSRKHKKRLSSLRKQQARLETS